MNSNFFQRKLYKLADECYKSKSVDALKSIGSSYLIQIFEKKDDESHFNQLKQVLLKVCKPDDIVTIYKKKKEKKPAIEKAYQTLKTASSLEVIEEAFFSTFARSYFTLDRKPKGHPYSDIEAKIYAAKKADRGAKENGSVLFSSEDMFGEIENLKHYIAGFSIHTYGFAAYLAMAQKERKFTLNLEEKALLKLFFSAKYLKEGWHSFCELEAAFSMAEKVYTDHYTLNQKNACSYRKLLSALVFFISLLGLLLLLNMSPLSIALAIIIPIAGVVTSLYGIAKIWPRVRYVTPLSFLFLVTPLSLLVTINLLTIAISTAGVFVALVSFVFWCKQNYFLAFFKSIVVCNKKLSVTCSLSDSESTFKKKLSDSKTDKLTIDSQKSHIPEWNLRELIIQRDDFKGQVKFWPQLHLELEENSPDPKLP